MGRAVTVDATGKVFERFLPWQLPKAPGVTGLRGGALALLSSLQARWCPQPHSAVPLPPSVQQKPPVIRPKCSLLGEQNRGQWEGMEAESFCRRNNTHVIPCLLAGCCSNWCSSHIYGWFLVFVFSKFLFFYQLHIMRKFLQSTMSTCKIKSFVFFFS